MAFATLVLVIYQGLFIDVIARSLCATGSKSIGIATQPAAGAGRQYGFPPCKHTVFPQATPLEPAFQTNPATALPSVSGCPTRPHANMTNWRALTALMV